MQVFDRKQVSIFHHLFFITFAITNLTTFKPCTIDQNRYLDGTI